MVRNEQYEKNEVGRDFVVGDLHGCYLALEEKLEDVKFNVETDRLFSVGDLVDRGPDNIKCLELLDQHWFHSVRGNHEQMFADYIDGYLDSFQYHRNGGSWVEYVDRGELKKWAQRVRDLPIAITVKVDGGLIGITHAEPPHDWLYVADEDYEEQLLWGRRVIRTQSFDHNVANVLRTYHGHTPLKHVVDVGNSRFIDTGACFNGGVLTVERIN